MITEGNTAIKIRVAAALFHPADYIGDVLHQQTVLTCWIQEIQQKIQQDSQSDCQHTTLWHRHMCYYGYFVCR